RALRRALCRIDRVLRRRCLTLQDADLPSRRSGRASLPPCVARRRRHAAKSARGETAADRAPDRRVAFVWLLWAGPASLRHWISRPARTGGLHRLFANPLSARGRAGLRHLRVVPAPQPFAERRVGRYA